MWEKIMTDDAAWILARHVCGTGYADLPASAVTSARRDILDTFGCMLGGSGSPGIDELFAVIARWGGRGGRGRGGRGGGGRGGGTSGGGGGRGEGVGQRRAAGPPAGWGSLVV